MADIQKYIQEIKQCLDLCREWVEAELRARNGICTMCFTDYQKEVETLLERIGEVDMEGVLLELAKHSKERIRSLATPLSRIKIQFSVNPYKDEFMNEIPLEYLNETWSRLYSDIWRINADMIMGIIQECDFEGYADLFSLPDKCKAAKDPKEQKLGKHFSSEKSEVYLTNIFNALVEKSFVSGSLSDWLFVFTGNGALNSKIGWTAQNSLTRKPSKISLLDFLVSMGFSEQDIRANINDCFSVANANSFSSKDYSKKKDWQRDMKSEYHNFFLNIVK